VPWMLSRLVAAPAGGAQRVASPHVDPRCRARVTRYDPILIWEMDMGDRHGIWFIAMVVYHFDIVILDIDMGYGLMIWEMTVSMRSSSRSIWDILSF